MQPKMVCYSLHFPHFSKGSSAKEIPHIRLAAYFRNELNET